MKASVVVYSMERYMKVKLEVHGDAYTFYFDRADLSIMFKIKQLGVNIDDMIYYFNYVREEMRAYLEHDRDLKHFIFVF